MTSFCTFYRLQDGDKTTDPIPSDIPEISENCLRYSTDKALHVYEGTAGTALVSAAPQCPW